MAKPFASRGGHRNKHLCHVNCNNRESDATALNIFIGVLTNENTGRESEAPAELFRPQVLPTTRAPGIFDPSRVIRLSYRFPGVRRFATTPG